MEQTDHTEIRTFRGPVGRCEELWGALLTKQGEGFIPSLPDADE